MYGSRKDDQYGAPPMDESKKDGQAGALTIVVVAPVAVPARVPMAHS
jgi:hypothetical protein